jgi:endo-alpha-1,4-polygalactosaminidase (GH114 family)
VREGPDEPQDRRQRARRGDKASLVARAAAMLACAAVLTTACALCTRRPNLASGVDLSLVNRWWILIGHSNAFDAIDWRNQTHSADMVVLSDDPRIPVSDLPPGTLRVGYLSVGEADRQQGYWAAVRGRPFLIEPDPNWPDNMRVDLRDAEWQRLLLDREVPRLLERGFQGLMLDTIDIAPYLENKDPVRFAGSRESLRAWLRELRRRHPGIVLLANGTDALVDAAPFVDGYVVEGMFATYDFGRRDYRPTTENERTWKMAQIDRAQAAARRPVFTIEYASVGDLALGQWAATESADHGFRPYVTVKDINSLP